MIFNLDDKGEILDTMEQIKSNDKKNKCVGALAIKELSTSIPTITLDEENQIAYITLSQ